MESCRGKFRDLKLLTVPALHIFSCINLVIDRYAELCKNNTNRYRLRRPHDLVLEIYNGKFAEKNPIYSGTRFFNRLPQDIKKLVSGDPNKIKNVVKKYLIEKELYTINEFLA